MFIGGLVPAAVMALCLMALIYLRARAAGAPRGPRAAAGVDRAVPGCGAILPLLMPGTLLAGILLGHRDADRDRGARGRSTASLLSSVVYREMECRALSRMALDTAALTGSCFSSSRRRRASPGR